MLSVLAAVSLAVSPLALARQAVAEGDMDGDGMLGVNEFQSQVLESSSFRNVCCRSHKNHLRIYTQAFTTALHSHCTA